MIQASKIIGTGLAFMGLIGVVVGIDFAYKAEASGLYTLMMAFFLHSDAVIYIYLFLVNFNYIFLFMPFLFKRGVHNDSSSPIVPAVSYDNADTEKFKIIFENKNKSGVYRWINKENGYSYIGSSQNLKRRFLEYFNTNFLINKNSMLINKVILYLIRVGLINYSE
uniref:GIY endonuclease n=1 Tax=Orbilia brochopaga TaxID=3140254 RepID=A0A481ZLK4_9PEZI|nr:GIY endonuclease [Drechslerella brochopaga]QBL02545.1 GIY endonuclease [Drechslerella brochopaga]